MVARKSQGATPSEKYLAKLGERTFLELWSYPNPYRDQGIAPGNPLGKELCDLLVVCGRDVVIFSDKSCAFPNSGDLARDWRRWFRRAVEKSVDQILGAERWIRQHPDRVFLDQRCTQRLPLPLAGTHDPRIHRVVVALGAKERCREEILGGSGSLAICSDVVGPSTPLTVGRVASPGGFVHVFDDVTLDIVMRELDTITDFLRYLRKKEELVLAGKHFYAAGEEDLLAFYLARMDPSGYHGFHAHEWGALAVDKGHWQSFATSPECARKRQADRPSYLWDEIIQEFSRHALAGTLLENGHVSLADIEVGLRIMAREPRLSRRFFATALTDLHRRSQQNTAQRHMRTVMSSDDPTTAYVFVLTPETGADPETYRPARQAWLHQYCFVVASRHRNLKRIVGLASELEPNAPRSFDLVLLTPGRWIPEQEEHARTIQQQMGLKAAHDLHVQPVHDNEYPPAFSAPAQANLPAPARAPIFTGRPAKVGRNDPCPCGSGRKFKRCCGR